MAVAPSKRYSSRLAIPNKKVHMASEISGPDIIYKMPVIIYPRIDHGMYVHDTSVR